MNLVDLVEARAAQHPERLALIDGRCGNERCICFREYLSLVNHTAAELSNKGLGHGSRVLVLVPMQSELYVTLAALWKIGATALFLDPSAGRQYIDHCCERTKPDAIIAIPKGRWLWWLNLNLRRVPVKLVWGKQLRMEQKQGTISYTTEIVDAQHPAILTFTSGSTGQPKGAIRSHGLLRAQYKALYSAIELEPGELELATMPIIALVNLAAGITTLIPDADLSRPGFVKASIICKQIERFQPNRCVASPAFLQCFPEKTGSLKKIYTGGAPVFPRGLRQIEQAFPGAEIHILYGSTEAEPISHIRWNDLGPSERGQIVAGRGLPVGKVAPEAEVRVIHDQWGQPVQPESRTEWDAMLCALGETGEIVVAGDHVIPGYLDGIGDEENKIKLDGRVWHRTGDAGYFDDRGTLWLMGRCAAKFKMEEEWIYPFPIEAAAVEHFAVPIAACCRYGGQATLFLPKLFRSDLPAEFTVGECTIRQILFKEIPLDKRHNAKVNYAKLIQS